MRKILLLLLPAALSFAFPACDDDAGGSTVVASSATTGSGMGGSGMGGTGMGGAGGGMGGAGGSTGGSGGTGGGLNCPEMGQGEPNDTEATALQLADVADDCDNSGNSMLGTLAGDSDVDWYFYESLADDTFCQIDPTRDISQSGGHTLELCKYVECTQGGYPDITCPNGTTDDTSPDGRPGCCGTLGFELGLDAQVNVCLGLDTLFVYMKVSEPGAQANNCNQYNITYRL